MGHVQQPTDVYIAVDLPHIVIVCTGPALGF